MVRVELDTFIERPIEEVFSQLINVSDYIRWMPKRGIFIRSGQTSDGPMGVGTTFYDRGWMGTFRGEIVAFEPPTRVSFREQLRLLGVPIMEARPGYELTSTSTGTRVKHWAEGELFGPFKVMQPMAARLAHGERKRTLDALKVSLEQG